MQHRKLVESTTAAMVLIFFTAAQNTANASIVTAIGDVDAVSIDSRPTNVDLLDNILGDNTDVLVIGGFATNSRSTALRAHWASLVGVSVTTLASSNVTPAQLSGIDFLFFAESAFAANSANTSTRQAISDFLLGGGDLLYVSQNLGNAVNSASYNSFLSDIGSSLGTTTTSTGIFGPGQSVVIPGPLTTGVTDFVISGVNEVTGGNALVTTGDIVTVAFENLDTNSKSGNVPEPSMFLVWAGLACCGTLATKRRR